MFVLKIICLLSVTNARHNKKNTFLNWNVRLQNVKGSQHLVLEQVAGGLRQDWYQECGILHSTQMPFLMRHAKFQRSFTIYDNPYRGSKHGQLLKQHPLSDFEAEFQNNDSAICFEVWCLYVHVLNLEIR